MHVCTQIIFFDNFWIIFIMSVGTKGGINS